jgi:hypothetical protein
MMNGAVVSSARTTFGGSSIATQRPRTALGKQGAKMARKKR